MPETRLVFLLMFVIFTAIIFIWSVICEKNDTHSIPKYLIVPVAADTENIELIAREIVLKAAEYYGGVQIILYNMGATEEQLIIFDKAINNAVEYRIVNA